MRAWLRGLPARRRAFVGAVAAAVIAVLAVVAVTVAVHVSGYSAGGVATRL